MINDRQDCANSWLKKWVILYLILVCVFFAFLPSLENGFTNWDDGPHLLSNHSIRSLTGGHLKEIFSKTVVYTYIPLTLLSFAVEYHFFGYAPFIYHLDNLLLHLGVVALLYIFALQLRLSWPAAALAALIFGLHPMRVESVAWVTERKDVLYAFFYMASMCSYMRYIHTNKKAPYVLSVLFGIASILSKPMAYSLPVILLLCEWFVGRRLVWKMFLDKIPFFLYILGVSLVTFVNNSNNIAIGLGDTIILWIWSFTFYILKFFWPVSLTPLYHVPEPVHITHPAYYWACLVALILLGMIVCFRKKRVFLLAFGFYLFSIFFLVVRTAWDFGNRTAVADRFMYLPSLGFCLLCGVLLVNGWQYCSRKAKWLGRAFAVLVMLLMFWLGKESFYQCMIWKDSVSLWSYVLKLDPENMIAMENRAVAYAQDKRYEQALDDYHHLIRLKPDDASNYVNRAVIYSQTKKYDLAFADFKKALGMRPDQYGAYFNLGNLYREQQKLDKAIEAYSMAIQLNGIYINAYNNRANLYFDLKQYSQAEADFKRILQLDPLNSRAYYNLSVIYQAFGRKEEAMEMAFKAQSLGFRTDAR